VWKNIAEPDRLQTTIWRIHTACWIPKATNTHSEYVILIAFPLQQWLHNLTSMLHYTYIACLVLTKAVNIGYLPSLTGIITIHTLSFVMHTRELNLTNFITMLQQGPEYCRKYSD